MLVTLKVVQNRVLFESLTRSFGARDSWSMRFIAAHGMSCRVEFSAEDLLPEHLLCFPDAPTVILAEARDLTALKRFAVLAQRLGALVRENEGMPFMVAPFIAVLDPGALAVPNYDLPDFVSDWLFGEVDAVELTHRILCALRARKLRKVHLQCGELTLLPDTRTVTFGGAMTRLSPTEFALGELFVSRMGSVISLAELSAFFHAAGKSTEPNNIRVTIHQLRLKLEELTRSQLKLCTIYRKGYCLRQSSRTFGQDEPASAHDTRISVA